MIQRKYGWIPDLPDQRDFKYKDLKATCIFWNFIKKLFTPPPPYVDLRNVSPDPYWQGQLGSCTGQAIAGDIQILRRIDNLKPDFVPSRLFIYYNERAMEGTIPVDSGAYLRDGIKSVAKDGVCTEDTWPYDLRAFATCPSDTAYEEASNYQSIKYYRIESVSEMKQCLMDGHPFVAGICVYESFETEEVINTGIVCLPNKNERLLGGHAIVVVGYDDETQRFLCRNSWGTNWGINGYFTIPYEYLGNSSLAGDFWTIIEMEQ